MRGSSHAFVISYLPIIPEAEDPARPGPKLSGTSLYEIIPPRSRFGAPLASGSHRSDRDDGWFLLPHLVAGRLDGAGAHPAPHQHDVRIRRIVEAMPAAARGIDHIALAGRLQALAGNDVALALQH